MSISKEQKNKQIAESMRLTAQRRCEQMPITFEFKVRKTKLNSKQKEFLKMVFVEAKWCYNWLVNQSDSQQKNRLDLFKFKGKDLNIITHKDKDGNDIEVELKYLGSSMKDSLVKDMCTSIKSLNSRKKKGYKVGRLKYESDHSNIFLKQYGITHEIISNNRVRVQGCRKPLPVSGIKQLKKFPLKYEMSTAELIKKNDDYYIHLTVFVYKNDYYEYKNSKKQIINKQLGIDFGCETSFTLSTGEKVNAFIEETDHLKRLNRRLAKQQKGSNNRWKTRKKIQREYYKLTCKKNEAANKLTSCWKKTSSTIIIQDEQINSWKKKHGKKIQHSILGRVKRNLMNSYECHVLNRFVPTTKFCSDCGNLHTEIQLWDRQFVCPKCAVVYDRDVHAAQNMIWLFNNLNNFIGLDGSEFKREDFLEKAAELFSSAEITH